MVIGERISHEVHVGASVAWNAGMGQRSFIMTFQDRVHPARHDPRALLNRPFVTFVILFSLGGAGWMPTLSFLSVFIRDELGGSVLSAAMVFLAIHGVTSTLGFDQRPLDKPVWQQVHLRARSGRYDPPPCGARLGARFSTGHCRRSGDGTVYCVSLDGASIVRHRIESGSVCGVSPAAS